MRTTDVCGLDMSALNRHRWHPGHTAGLPLCCMPITNARNCKHSSFTKQRRQGRPCRCMQGTVGWSSLQCLFHAVKGVEQCTQEHEYHVLVCIRTQKQRTVLYRSCSFYLGCPRDSMLSGLVWLPRALGVTVSCYACLPDCRYCMFNGYETAVVRLVMCGPVWVACLPHTYMQAVLYLRLTMAGQHTSFSQASKQGLDHAH